MKTSVLKKVLKNIQSKYGYTVLILLLDYYQNKEEYEVCQEIEIYLKELEINLKVEIDRTVSNAFIADYQAEFWKLGLSGETAVSNLSYYYFSSILEIDKANLGEI